MAVITGGPSPGHHPVVHHPLALNSPLIASLDTLLIDGLSDDEDDAFAAALDA